MNKAFTREPDQTADFCPRCGSQGQSVEKETLAAHLSTEQLGGIASRANFCPSPRCDVAYFDSFERTVLAKDLPAPVYPKDPEAPLCACFGLTREQIEQDIQDGTPTRTRAILEKAKSSTARCSVLSANGRPCVTYVQKYYLERLKAKQQG